MLIVVLSVGEVALHTFLTTAYYVTNLRRLQLIAAMAAGAGAEHLPGNPALAVRIARSCANLNGVTGDEIVFIHTSTDNQVLTIRLDQRIPKYFALFAFGLSTPELTVTASARSLTAHRRLYASIGLRFAYA
jgi:hypothetical protein